MRERIQLNGKKYDINFGMACLSKFCQLMKMPMSKLVEAIDYGPIQLIHCALVEGSRKSKKELPWESWEDLSDYFDDNEKELEEAVGLMIESLPKDKSDKKK